MALHENAVPGMAEAIERRRVERGLTVSEFARAAGVTPQGLVPLRKGVRRNYRERLKIGVCAALGWTPDSVDLLLKEHPPNEATDHEPARTAVRATDSVTRDDLDAVRRELKADVRELLGETIVIDLDVAQVDANAADGGTLSFLLDPPREFEVGEHITVVFRGSRRRMQELRERLAGHAVDNGADT